MFYQSSKGPREIAKMPYPHALNALNRLHREEPERVAEIEALEAHVASLADKEPGEAENPRVVIGGNNPPEETPAVLPTTWGALKLHLDSLLDQVRGITGVEIASQDMADQTAKLLRDLQQAISAADDARTAEKAPHDEVIKEIQDRYNAYIAPIKNKAPGTASKAEVALKNQIGAWLRKLDDDRRAKEDEARKIAEAAEAAALAAHVAARESDDLDEIDAAEDLIAAADNAARNLKSAENAKSNVKVDGARAVHLRSVWKAERVEGEGGKSLKHYAGTQAARIIDFIQILADEDVRAGVRMIPGFIVKEERVV